MWPLIVRNAMPFSGVQADASNVALRSGEKFLDQERVAPEEKESRHVATKVVQRHQGREVIFAKVAQRNITTQSTKRKSSSGKIKDLRQGKNQPKRSDYFGMNQCSLRGERGRFIHNGRRSPRGWVSRSMAISFHFL